MKLLTKEIEAKLSKNIGNATKDKPYLKLFNPMGSATWLISEYHKEDRTFFGLCDLGMGYPELGYVSIDELESVRLAFGLGVERDLFFEPTKTLSEYAAEARELGSIRA